MIFCTLFAAALTACGGGGGASGGGGPAATADAGSSTSSLAASTTDSSAASTTTADAGTVPVPDNSAIVSTSDSTVAEHSVDTLGAKSTPTTVTVTLASEGQSFQVFGTMAVQYGAGSSWVTRNVTSNGTCSASFFGVKSASGGTAKTCQIVLPINASSMTSAVGVGLPASEGGTFFVFGRRSVQYGANGKFIKRDVTGRGECTNAFFGSDPNFNTPKSCSFTPTSGATSTLAVSSLMPAIDTAKIPAPAIGFSTARVQAANVADPGQNPAASDIGDFREYCEFSHMSYDDPIVAPGSTGAHLHVFLGNTGTNSKSTAASIAGSGNSTCAGGTLNRTSYWMPAVIDTTDGSPQKPLGSLIYYKQGYNGVPSAAIRPFPAGLRIVAGSAASSSQQDLASFTCNRPDGSWQTVKAIPTDCPANSTLTIAVAFPQCWDGINLDSPDHKSHMAYPGNGCPATHPVALTAITFEINYKVGSNGTSRWRLSSDNYDNALPGGYSSHADWYNGWNPEIMNVWTTRCINATLDCHAFLIGDGRMLY